MDRQSIARINELTRLSRQRALTAAEKEEREKLRDAYRKAFRAQFRAQINNTIVEYPDGRRVPLKDAAKENRGMNRMDEEKDLVYFEDEDGNEVSMEVLDYLYYEGREYALLSDVQEDDSQEESEVFVMEVCPIEGDDENEEFVPVEEDLARRLVNVFQNKEEM